VGKSRKAVEMSQLKWFGQIGDEGWGRMLMARSDRE
jgi:hypothetical protein